MSAKPGARLTAEIGRDSLGCPICGADVDRYLEDAVTLREFSSVRGGRKIVIHAGYRVMPERSTDERLQCGSCGAELEIPEGLELVFA